MTDKWIADPTRGQAFVQPRHEEIIARMKTAGDVAVAAIDGNEREALKRIKEEAAQKRAAVMKKVNDVIQMEPMRAVRKYFHVSADDMWRTFLDNGETKINNID